MLAVWGPKAAVLCCRRGAAPVVCGERYCYNRAKAPILPGHPTRRAVVLLPLTGLLLPLPVAAAPVDAVGRSATTGLLADFGFDPKQRRAVEAGRIVAIDAKATLDNELSGAVAMRLALPAADVASRLRRGLVVLADPRITAYAALDDGKDDAAWAGVGFTAAEQAEVVRLSRIEPGDTFNLSTAEIATIRQALAGVQPQSPEASARASEAYRAILIGRWRAYRNSGLSGLAGYDRGNTTIFPGESLRRIDAAMSLPPLLAPLARALDSYPAAQPAGLESLFFWKKTIVDDRTTFVLSHVAVEETADAVLFALREYYVGQSYDALQQLGVVMADGEQVVMLAINSTLTDRITGPLGIIARPLGRRFARDALASYFARIRDLCSAPLP